MKDCCLALVLGLLSFVLYRHSPITQGYDSRWSLYVAQSVLHEGNVNIDEYREEIINDDRFGIRKKQGHLYNFFPIGTSLLATPLLWLAEQDAIPISSLVGCVRRDCWSQERGKNLRCCYQCLEKEFASFFMALTIAFLYLCCRELTSRKVAFSSAGLIAFGTSAYSIASRALWQHGPTMLCLTLTLYCLLRAQRKADQTWILAAAPLAFSYWVRPSNSLSIVFLSLYVLYTYRLRSWKFFALLLIVLLPFVSLNQSLYGTMLPPYYRSTRLVLSWDAPFAFAAHWLSPSRGLLIFSPFLLWAMLEARRQLLWIRDPLMSCLVIIIVAHSAVISFFPHWWGGHTFGARMMSDLIPYLGVLFALSCTRKSFWTSGYALLPLCLCCMFSASIHSRAANSRAPYKWNLEPRNVDEDPSRIWDWKDPQWRR